MFGVIYLPVDILLNTQYSLLASKDTVVVCSYLIRFVSMMSLCMIGVNIFQIRFSSTL